MKPRNYQCRKCGKINQIKTPFGMFITPHLGWRKWIKCEHCGAKRHFQRRVFQPEMKLRDEVEFLQKSNAVLLDQKQEALHNLDEADGYYCSMIDNLRDDIQDLKQQLALETAARHDATKHLAAYKKRYGEEE